MEEESPMKVFMDAGLTGKEQVPEDVPVVNATFLNSEGEPVNIGAGGQPGPAGEAAGFGNITATVDNTTGTPQVSVQADGPNTAKNISFSFTGLKGEKGEKGDPGGAGTQINSILPLTVETPPDEGSNTGNILFGDNVRITSSGARNGVGIGVNVITDGGAVSIGSSTVAGSSAIAIGSRSHAEGYGSNTGGIALGENANTRTPAAVAIGANSSVTRPSGGSAENSVALGAYSTATEDGVVSVGSGVTTLTLSDDMPEEQQAAARAAADVPTRRIVNVTDPQNAQDAATKNYVDTQLEPINAKLQYVPENTNQVLSQIQTNAEKAQSAAEAAQTTAESKASQADLTALQATVAQLQETVTQLQAKVN